ncbi:Acyl-CoA:diacylglycerol acyltransferase [Frankia sp. Hr75.2]|nr:Acyl-CoA:diacylglycerol acyltransferase [Frankia sp. Hr75.2]
MPSRAVPPSRRVLLAFAATAVGGGLAGCSDGSGAPAPPAPPASSPSAAPASAATTPVAGAGTPAASAVAAGPVEVSRVTFASAARGRQVGMVVIAPGGSRDGLPACLVLHGRGDDAERSVGLLNLDRYLTAALAVGVAPFALVAVDGGETYWHRRASGDDPEKMIIDEVLPRFAGLGLRATRLAATGWSMGGYGALLLARRHPGLVVAVAASSPAMWPSYGASAPGAFDSRADFAAHPVLGTPPVPGVSYRIDCGAADPFLAVSRQAARDLAASEQNFGPGGHTPEYWRSVVPAQLAFLSGALSRAA